MRQNEFLKLFDYWYQNQNV